MRIANIIATGTEVTSGQILNTNSTWIAQQLVNFNFEVQRHLAVDDNEDRILDSLILSHKESDLVVVTGGLGPTTDDLSRKIVADWAGKRLDFNENEWLRIQSRLKKLEVTPRDGHKWQAYFPEGATVFINNAGTASGFSLEITKNNKTTLFWFLPGPPNEIQKIWEDHLNTLLIKIGPQKNTQLYSWSFIDLAESELAHIVEPLLSSKSYKGITVGYRASPPIVELKVWLPINIKSSDIPEFIDIENQLKEHLHFKNADDPMMKFFDVYFKDKEMLYVQDELTSGELFNRLENLKTDILKKDPKIKFPKIYFSNTEFKSPKFPFLKLTVKDPESFSFEFFEDEENVFKQKIVFKRKVSTLRQSKWICEKLFKSLSDKFA